MTKSASDVKAADASDRSLWGPTSGIVFVVLLIASFSVAPIPPDRGAASEAVRAYFVTGASGVRITALLQSFAAVALLLFVCWLAEIVRSDPRGRIAANVVLGAGILTLGASLAGTAVSATLASGGASDIEKGSLRALFDLGMLILNVGNPMVAALVGVFSIASSRSTWMPRWLTSLGVVVTASWIIGSAAIVVTSGPLASPTGPYGMAMVALLLAWIVATSIALRRAP